MRKVELKVADDVSNSIHGFWYRNIDPGPEPTVFEVLPDGHAEIVFHVGSGCSLLVDGSAEPLPSPFIVGLLNKPVFFQTAGRLQVVGIKCLPWAVYDLLQLPAVKGGVQTFSHPIARLQTVLERLLAEGRIEEALELVRNWCLENHPSLAPELKKAGSAMLDAKGALPVSSVASAAHATVRTLERKFKASSGNTVKDVSGLIRFERACNELWKDPATRISGLAAQFGYADQSHLNREFKRYTGVTAAAFAKQIAVRLKELGDDFVAIVLSS